MSREAAKDYSGQRIDDYLWQKSSGTLLSAVEELRYLMRQPFYLADSVIFHPARLALVRYSEAGRHLGVTGDARPFKRADTAIFAWTDG